MGQTNGRRRRWLGAFTIVEMNIVLFVLVLIAAFVVPNVVAIQRSRNLKNLEGAIARLPVMARNDAVRSSMPVRLRIVGSAIVMERAPLTGGDPATVLQVPLSNDIVVDSVRQNGKAVDTGSWQWTAYPDGTADSGGMEFVEGQARRSLVLPAHGDAQWVARSLPDSGDDQWPAGQLELRAQ